MEPLSNTVFPVPIYPPPPGGVVVGSNATDAPFAVIIEGELGDRYLHGYGLEGCLVWDLFRWNPQAWVPVYEVRASQPVGEGSWTGAGGSLQFRSPDDDFEMSLSLGVNSPVLEIAVGSRQLIADSDRLTVDGSSFESCSVSGMFAMLRLESDGSIGFGISGPPPSGMALIPVSVGAVV